MYKLFLPSWFLPLKLLSPGGEGGGRGDRDGEDM